MKVTFAGFCLIGAIFIAVINNSSVHAQVIPDGTLNTTVTDTHNFTINNGTRVGNNLFHSFSQFSIPSNGSASFKNATDIQNIFSRVTGGNVSQIDGLIQANGSLSTQGDLSSFSYSIQGNSGNGGNIALAAQNGDIVGNGSSLYTFSVALPGTASNGGMVSLDAQNLISGLTVLTTSFSAEAGSVSIVGRGDLAIADLAIQTSKPVTLNTPSTGSIVIPIDGTGRSGNVRISSIGNLTLSNSRIESDTKGSDSAGNVTLTSPGLTTFNQSQIISSTSSTGQAGNISITTDSLMLLNGSSINSSTSASGNAGGIKLNEHLKSG